MRQLVSAVTEFRDILHDAHERLTLIPNAEASAPVNGGSWSKKQILGHLIDSAANNHQRFVRAQLQSPLETPGYEQDLWVNLERFQDRDWYELIEFWVAYNRHLLHMMEFVPTEHLSALIKIGGKEAVTLQFVMIDYVRHLKHHLDQILK